MQEFYISNSLMVTGIFFIYGKPSAWRYQPQQNSSKQTNKNNTDFFTQKL